MKGKTLLCFAILATLLIATVPFSHSQILDMATFYFDPATVIGPPPTVGQTIYLTIRTTPIMLPEGLFQWVMDIQWDPAVFELVDGPDLDLLANPEEGTAIKMSGATAFLYESISPGLIKGMTCVSLFGADVHIPPNPNDLVAFTFKVKGYTFGSDIVMVNAVYLDIAGHLYIPSVSPFHFELPPPPPTPPTAAFTPPTCTVFYVGQEVEFNGMASTGGYDGDDPTSITEYRWDFGDGTPILVDGSVVHHTYSTTGDKSVTLEVYAPGIPPFIDPRYIDTDAETHIIHIIPIPIGPDLDVYTERNGLGHGLPSDAFGPQEEITVYAKVTYNNDPVANKLVGFEVKDNEGNPVLSRTAASGMDGIATFSFRVPWTGMEAEEKFGSWCIYGSVDIAEQPATDYCPFEFGYIVKILSVTTTDDLGAPKSTFLKGEDLHVELQLKDISFNSKTVLVTVTVYDDCGVPIGFAMIPGVLIPSGTSIYFDMGITIPYWRFKGVGRVYVNLFTAMPQSGGVPYCPEGSTIFTLG